MLDRLLFRFFACVSVLTVLLSVSLADEPPAINPFGKKTPVRNDAVRGQIIMSNGTTYHGLIYLTRDKRLKIYDQSLQRQREVPLNAVKQIDCEVEWERLEAEWRFKETTSDEKLYTGRNYPVRQYLHKITLKDGRTITGPMAEILYLQSENNPEETKQFILHKRDKGKIGQDLPSLLYVKQIKIEDK